MVHADGFCGFTALDERDAAIHAVVMDGAIRRFRVPEFDGHVWLAIAPSALLSDIDLIVVKVAVRELDFVLSEKKPIGGVGPDGLPAFDPIGSAVFVDDIVMNRAVGEIADLQGTGARLLVRLAAVFHAAVVDAGFRGLRKPCAGELQADEFAAGDAEMFHLMSDDAAVCALVIGQSAAHGEVGDGGIFRSLDLQEKG